MTMRKTLVSVLVAAGILGAVAMPTMSEASGGAEWSIRIGHPHYRAEFVPEGRFGYVWVPGYWHRHGYRQVWVEGAWVRERRGSGNVYGYGNGYQPQRWSHPEDWRYRNGGRWDRDGDGIPDHRDRHPNNPYRP